MSGFRQRHHQRCHTLPSSPFPAPMQPPSQHQGNLVQAVMSG